MQKEEIFAILGVDETKDERALKNAYRQQLMHTNPEDDPEGFKRLREAYEAACDYAANEEEEEVSYALWYMDSQGRGALCEIKFKM
mgnify:CR=1 FL=1